MPESLAGVTILALGNGAPDLFSTFTAMKAGSGSLAIGELVGASSFITTMVVGSVAYFSPFVVQRRPFFRDVLFFFGALLLMLVVISDKTVHFVEGVVMIIYYLFYVMVVVLSSWLHKKSKERPKIEDSTLQAEEGVEETKDGSDDEIDAESAPLIPKYRRGSLPRIVTDIPIVEEDRMSDLIPFPSSPRARHNKKLMHKKSLISAVEFYEAVQHSKMGASSSSISPNRLSVGSNQLLTPNDFTTFKKRRNSWHVPESYFDDIHQHLPEEILDRDQKSSNLLIPLSTNISTSSSQAELDSPTSNATADNVFPSTASLLNESDYPPQETEELQDSIEPTASHFNTRPPIPNSKPSIVSLLFPIVHFWKHKSRLERFTGTIITPIWFLLRITIPVVDLSHPSHSFSDTTTSKELYSSDIIPVSDETRNFLSNLHATYFHPGLTLIQIFMAGFMICFTLFDWSNTTLPLPYRVLVAFSVTTFLTIFSTVWMKYYYLTTPDYTSSRPSLAESSISNTENPDDITTIREQAASPLPSTAELKAKRREKIKYRGLAAICWVGFCTSVVWIYVVANEVVGILKAYGLILNISHALLGMTIFAIGNSLGDAIANVTMAKLGYPLMAVSACYGSPMLNLVLGVGFSVTYITFNSSSYTLTLDDSIFAAIIVLLSILLISLIVVPLSHFQMGKMYGLFLVACYAVLLTVICVVEIVT
ncbi:Sodium/calcium exchanger protein-domain-containing protein [Paraphysoderma sedebokerense]|nr:Sodium/calcium exchanger protein-domain-containing protein [Paraphysoderma sedebokerense]